MLERLKAWYQAALVWLGVSEPGDRKAQVEDALVEEKLRTLIEGLWDHRNTSGKGRFPQILRGGLKPSDRQRLFNHGINIPVWGDLSIDEWEGPSGRGCTINFWVTETDATEWVLRLHWNDGEGNDFKMDPWSQVLTEEV